MGDSVQVTVSTDTATVCLFDLERLRHRKEDVGDWWSIERFELAEVNAGNALFFNLGQDGTYQVQISVQESVKTPTFAIRVSSGTLFLGPGEETSGGGFEPDGKWGGIFFPIPPGNYLCSAELKGANLVVALSPGGDGSNSLADLIRL